MANRCRQDGCLREDVHAHGLCLKHYRRFWRWGDASMVKRDTSGFLPSGALAGVSCSESGCKAQAWAKGLCNLHYMRRMRARLQEKPGFREYMRAAARKHRATPSGKARTHLDNAKRRAASSEGDASREFLAFALARATSCSVCLGSLGSDRTIEHEVPLSRGGRHDMNNIQIAHRYCNVGKGARLWSEMGR